MLTSASFTRIPNGDELAEYYPDVAQRESKTGTSTIKCVVTPRGSLTNCQVLSESPAGYGFGQASVRMARVFKIKPATRDGKPVEGTITLPDPLDPAAVAAAQCTPIRAVLR